MDSTLGILSLRCLCVCKSGIIKQAWPCTRLHPKGLHMRDGYCIQCILFYKTNFDCTVSICILHCALVHWGEKWRSCVCGMWKGFTKASLDFSHRTEKSFFSWNFSLWYCLNSILRSFIIMSSGEGEKCGLASADHYWVLFCIYRVCLLFSPLLRAICTLFCNCLLSSATEQKCN